MCLHQQVEEIISAVKVRFGNIVVSSKFTDAPLEIRSDVAPELRKAKIGDFLYAVFYAGDPSLLCRDGLDHMVKAGYRLEDPDFVSTLVSASPTKHYRSPGWALKAHLNEGDIRVEKSGVELRAVPGKDCSETTKHLPVGSPVEIYLPSVSLLVRPGFVVFRTVFESIFTSNVVRFYLNLRQECAPLAISRVLRALNDHEIKYLAKVVAEPKHFCRRDNTVLYTAKYDADIVKEILLAVTIRDSFYDAIPYFTQHISCGIAIAGQPPSQDGVERSFGEHITECITEGIIRCAESHPNADMAQMREFICQSMQESSVDPTNPSLL